MSSKQQDYTEYTVDLSQLTKERPLGVTGILRCQNSADFLDACIESCIEGLDELIAVYHNCTDETAIVMPTAPSKKSGSTLWNKLLISYIHLTCIILKRTKVQKENGKTG